MIGKTGKAGPPDTGARFVPGIGAIAHLFDGWLVDQWGVLHDGEAAYPGAAECLARLAGAGKAVVVVSNSGRRAAPNLARMEAMGLSGAFLAGVVTSGEVAWAELLRRTDPFFRALGRRCLLMSRGGDRSIVEGLDLELVGEAGAADFVLLSGTDTPSRTVEDYTRALEEALARRLPMVCANPDMVAVSPGGLIATPGTVAAWYAAAGGTVRYVGKPHPEILRHALAALPSAARRRLAAVGDSLAHDIAGGRSIGAATVLVEGGIHAAELAVPDRSSALAVLAREHGVAPDWLVPSFTW